MFKVLIFLHLFSIGAWASDMESSSRVTSAERSILSSLCVREQNAPDLSLTMNGCLGGIGYVVDNLDHVRSHRMSLQSLEAYCETIYSEGRRLRGCQTGVALSLEYFDILPSRPHRFDRPLLMAESTFLSQQCSRQVNAWQISAASNGCSFGIRHAFSNQNSVRNGTLELADLQQYCIDNFFGARRRQGCLAGLEVALRYVNVQFPVNEYQMTSSVVETPEASVAQ